MKRPAMSLVGVLRRLMELRADGGDKSEAARRAFETFGVAVIQARDECSSAAAFAESVDAALLEFSDALDLIDAEPDDAADHHDGPPIDPDVA